jgi:hypothetical protein
VAIYKSPDGSFIRFTSDLSICNDGSGPSHGDQTFQAQTAYYNKGKYLNADKDKYVVVPPQIRNGVPGIVMGCRARLTNTATGVVTDAVVGDIGPKDKTGEAAYCAAKVVNPAISYNAGDDKRIYLYELWPGVPAVVDGKKYALEAA